MANNLSQIIKEQVNRTLNEKKEYMKARAIVESYVREALLNKIVSERKIHEKKTHKSSKSTQVRQALNDPAINKSGLARKIEGLSGNDDTRRSEISKIARGDWTPDVSIQNDILHTISSNL